MGDDAAADVPTNLGGPAKLNPDGSTPAPKDDDIYDTRAPSKNMDDLNPGIISDKPRIIGAAQLPSNLIELSLRLSPLGPVEEALIAALSSDDPSSDDYEAVRLGAKDLLKGRANGRETALSAMHWRRTLRQKLSAAKLRKASGVSNDIPELPSNSNNRRTSMSSGLSMKNGTVDEDDETTVGDALDATIEYDILGTLKACSQDMIRLWKDQYVKEVLKRRRFRPQDSSGL